MRRVERLINLIAALLNTHRPLTSEEIRTRIQGYEGNSKSAFRRAFERDKADLRAAGIPIELKKVDPLDELDGYYIPKDRYYLPQLDLEADELAALRLAAASLMGGGEAASIGVLKLSMDEDVAPAGGPPVLWSADLAAEQPFLAVLYAALTGRRPVRFRYTGAEGSSAEDRSVEIYTLAHRRGHWYVVGRDAERDAIRTFRVSRIEGGVQAQAGSYEIPTDFDADAHSGRDPWEMGSETRTATVRFDPSLRWWVEQNLAGRPTHGGSDGSIEVELLVANTDALISWVVGFAAAAEIVSPPQARAALVDHLRPLIDETKT